MAQDSIRRAGEDFLTLAAAAKYLSISERSLRRCVDEIPHFRFGRKYLFRRSELDKWVEKFRKKEPEQAGIADADVGRERES